MTDTNEVSSQVMASVVNAAVRRLEIAYPGYFQTDEKHQHYYDFGYPQQVTFSMLWQMFQRNGIAKAAVSRYIDKTWQDLPWMLEKDDPHDETAREKEVAKQLRRVRFWQQLIEADRRSLVGEYSGLILRIADNQPFKQPASPVSSGLKALIEVIPAWQGQLTVSDWESDEKSDSYGQPKMYQFNETVFENKTTKTRSFEVHPSRVVIWSRDGTVHGESILKSGFNDLLVMEKVVGAGGEGFWKNARSNPFLSLDKDAKLENVAKGLGVPISEIADKMDAAIKDWQKGFDSSLFTQGVDAKTLQVTLPSPEHFFAIALQCFAASVSIPTKVLTGNQTGERASSEDMDDWSQTVQARRNNIVIPNIEALMERLRELSILPREVESLVWSDLTEMTLDKKIVRADKMAGINQKLSPDEGAFTVDEIRSAVDFEPLSVEDAPEDDEQEEIEDTQDDDAADADAR